MNKEQVTGLLIGAAITAFLLLRWHNMKVDAMENSYNDNLAMLSVQDTDIVEQLKSIEFIDVGNDCELIKQFKMSLNYLGGAAYFDELSFYSAENRDLFTPILKNTSNFLNENGGLRKSFLYDINIAIANMLDVEDFPLREFKYEYSEGVLNKGDKGQQVNKLQELLNLIHYKSNPKQVNGTYDKETYTNVVNTFKGTTALIDSGTGTLAKEFVNNFSKIIENLTYQYIDDTLPVEDVMPDERDVELGLPDDIKPMQELL